MIAEIPSGTFEIPQYALWALAGWVLSCLLSGWIGYKFSWGKYNSERRINFVSRISELKSSASKVEDGQFPNWFAQMQVIVERECALVESAIPRFRRKQFEIARKSCDETQAINDPRPPQPGLLLNVIPIGPDILPPLTYSASKKNICEILDSLISSAK